MASTGKKGKKNKGKTLALTDFLANTKRSWSDEVDEAERLIDFNRKPALPAAPRAARAAEFDETRIPKNPPYVAYLSNLSYEVEEKDISDCFVDLNISNVRLPRDDRTERLKGFGYVEFNDRLSFVSALQMYEAIIKGRRVKIDIADHEGDRRRGGQRGNRDRDSMYDQDRSSSDWRSGPRSEYLSDDKRGSMSRRDYGFRDRDGFRDKEGFRDRDRDKDRDGIDRGRGFGDRETNWRDSERRFTSERDHRSSYGSRRNYDERDGSNPEPKTRRKLNLKPRTRPIEEIDVKEEATPAPTASIFGQAKPVDTAAREREIEERLAKERELGKTEKEFDRARLRSKGDNIGGIEKEESVLEGKENLWSKSSQRKDPDDTTSQQEVNNGRISDVEDNPSNPENDQDSLKEVTNDGLEREKYRKNEENENDRSDSESRYSRHNRSESRYNDNNKESDRSYRREDKFRGDDRDRRDKDKRDYERRDRGNELEGKGRDSGGKYRDQEKDGDRERDRDKDRDRDRDGDGRRYNNEREIDNRRYNNEKEPDGKKYSSDREGDSKRFQEREGGRYREQEDHSSNKIQKGDKKVSASGDRGTRQGRGAPEKDRLPQMKDRPKESKKAEDAPRMPKLKEAAAPNYIGTNKYSYLQEDGASE